MLVPEPVLDRAGRVRGQEGLVDGQPLEGRAEVLQILLERRMPDVRERPDTKDLRLTGPSSREAAEPRRELLRELLDVTGGDTEGRWPLARPVRPLYSMAIPLDHQCPLLACIIR